MISKVLFEDYFDISSQIKKDAGSFSIPLGITEENIFETLDVTHHPHRHMAVTAITWLPRTSCATFSKNVESTPEEKAMATLPIAARSIFSLPSFSCMRYMEDAPKR